MTLKELKVLCIKYIDQTDEELNSENLIDYKNSSQFSSFINNILFSINRAISRINESEKVEPQEVELGNIHKDFLEWVSLNLSKFGNIHKITTIYYLKNDGSPLNTQFKHSSKTQLFVYAPVSTLYFMRYNPKIPTLTDLLDDDELSSYGLTDNLCLLIPLFVKSELWENEEPELAQKYRVLFEQELAQIHTTNDNLFHQDRVEHKFRY